MKLDAHVHTIYSGASSIRPLRSFMRECYNTPDQVYRRARARGMDLVAITDHDQIAGALTIANRPDVIIGCEVTGVFPRDGVRVHLGVLGLTEAQFRDVDQLRHDITELMPYLRQQQLFVSLNHVASRINGHITARHIAALLPWLNGMEIRNGSRLASQNRTAERLARANGRVPVAGSDSHTRRGIGQTWVEAPHARSREEFLAELRAGRVRVGGRQGNGMTMASDIIRMTAALYREHTLRLLERPAELRRVAAMAAMAVCWPAVMVPIAIAMVHFGLEMRFNRALLSDVARRPELGLPEPA